jgi:hypothetical protein
MHGTLKTTAFAIALLGLLILPPAARAGDRAKELWSFGQGGYSPAPGLVADANGDLYGATGVGGIGPCSSGLGCGTIYELSPPPKQRGAWTYSVLYQFQGGTDGGEPFVQLAQDTNGVLYGYTTYSSPGTVFSLTPGKKGSWAFKTIYVFTGGADGSLTPSGAPLVASGGNLYGVAPYGGVAGCFDGNGCGTFFQLAPGAPNAPWTETTLIAFKGNAAPGAPNWLVGSDANSAFYLSTGWDNGAVLRYVVPAHGRGKPQVLTRFRGGKDGTGPGNLVLGVNGDIYGLAGTGEFATEVFQLAPQDGQDHWLRTVIAKLSPHGYPPTWLNAGPAGTLLGTVYGDVDFYYGNVFSLTPPGDGGVKWKYQQLWSFTKGPDYNPLSVTVGQGANQTELFVILSGGDSTLGSVALVYPHG